MYKLTQVKKKKIASEVKFQFSRSSGPGGQKVNKTETQAELRWPLAQSQVFPQAQLERLQEKLSGRINKQGELVLQSDKFRSRPANQKQCWDLLWQEISRALTLPKARKPTRPTRASQEKRLQEKKKRGERKRHRQKWDS